MKSTTKIAVTSSILSALFLGMREEGHTTPLIFINGDVGEVNASGTCPPLLFVILILVP